MASDQDDPISGRLTSLLDDAGFGDRDAYVGLCQIVLPTIASGPGSDRDTLRRVVAEMWREAPRFDPSNSAREWIEALVARVTEDDSFELDLEDPDMLPFDGDLRDEVMTATASPQVHRMEIETTSPSHWLWSGRGIAVAGSALVLLVLIVSLAGGGATTADQLRNAGDARPITVEVAGFEARLVFSESLGGAVIEFDDLAELRDEQVYQLWVNPSTDPTPAGIFSSSGRQTTVMPTESLEPTDVVGLSIERAGGSDTPSAIIVEWDLG